MTETPGGLPGLGSSGPVPGADPVLPDPLGGAFAAATAAQTMASLKREAMFREAIEAGAMEFIQKALESATEAVQHKAAAAAVTPGSTAPATATSTTTTKSGAGAAGGKTPVVAPKAAPHTSPAPPITPHVAPHESTTPPPEVDTTSAPHGGAPEQRVSAQFRQGLQTASSGSMESIARGVAKVFHGLVHSKTDEYQAQPDGSWLHQPSNTVVQPGTPEATKITRLASLESKLQGFSEGGIAGLGGELGGVAEKFAGPIGVTVGAVLAAGHWAEGQNAAAVPYRQGLGASTGAAPFAAEQRVGEWMAGLRGFGTVGMGTGREEFQVASALGLTGEHRTQAVDFSQQMYRQFGMNTQQSMQVVQQAIDTGNVSLGNFADAITKVSRAAVSAGQASQTAIEGFLAAQKAVSQNMVTGQPSVDIAQQAAVTAAGLDTGLATSIGGAAGVAGMATSQQTIMLAAMQTGQNPMAALGRSMDPVTAGMQANRTMLGVQSTVTSRVAAFLQMSESEFLAEVKKQTGGSTQLSTDDQHRILLNLCGGSYQTLAQVLGIAAAAMGMVNQNPPQGQVINMLFADILRKFGTGSTTNPSFTPKMGAGGTGWVLQNALGYSGSDVVGAARSGGQGTAGQNLPYIQTYLGQIKQSGVRNKALEWLLAKGNQGSIEQTSGASSLQDVRFSAKNRAGETIKVSMADILKSQRYQNELTTGDVSILTANRNDTAESVAAMSGIRDQTKKGSGTASTTTPSGVHVSISLTNQAAQLVNATVGPSSSQMAGVPAGSSLDPSQVPGYGGQ